MSNFDYTLEPGRKRENCRAVSKHEAVISIITPAWNPNSKIFQLANCILNQTYPYYEWLIIDDGSTNPESLKYFDELEKMDTRIKVLHKENEGLSRTRDYGVKHSSKNTEYIVFIDDDDLLNKTYLECAYYTMNTHKDASWCYSDVVNFEGQQTLWNKLFSSYQMKYENLLVSQAMIKKEAFYDVGGYQLEGNGHYEDWVFWLKLLGKKRYPIHMSFYGFWYRREAKSGQLKLAKSNHKRNMKLIKEYANKIPETIYPIEYPKEDYNWEGITTKVDSVVAPKFKKDGKTNLLIIIPWMVLGGADKFNLDLFRLMDKEKYRITLVSTQPSQYIWRQQFEEVCDEVFDLSTFLDRKDWTSFVSYLIESRNIDIIFNTNSQIGYVMLPYLHALYPKIPILDYIHMEEWYNRHGGYSRDSAAVGSVIDKTLFCNKNSQQILVDYFKRKPESVDTVYIGVDTERFDPKKHDRKQIREKYHISEDRLVISMIARIDYQKRPFLLVKIIRETVKVQPNAFFVIAGDGPLLKDVQKTVMREGLEDYVLFLGRVDNPDEIYVISDMTLNCSIKEGLALTTYESLAMGVPVISSDVGGQKELIDDKTGVIVPCLQKEADIFDVNYTQEEIQNYVDAIVKVTSKLERYKKNCRKHILAGFTIQNMVDRMQQEFDQLLQMDKKQENQLKDHLDILLELINLCLVVDQEQYEWYCYEYRMQVYGVEKIEMTGKQRLIYHASKIAYSLNMSEEFDQLGHIAYAVLRYVKRLLESIIMIPTLIVKFIFRFISLEYNRIKRVIKRKVG